MANEIAITTKLVLTNSSLLYRDEPGIKYVTQTTGEIYDEVQSWSTSDTALACGALATSSYGLCRVTNLDPTNYASMGPEHSGAIKPCIRLAPGESSGWFRCEPSVTWRRQANTGTVKVRVQMLRT